jgi:hypothetical protein
MQYCSEYYNENAQYLYTDNVFSGGQVKFIKQFDWDSLTIKYPHQIFDLEHSYHDVIKELDKNSKTISIQNAQSDFQTMASSLALGKERIGYIVLDIFIPKLFFYLDSDSYNAENAPMVWKGGDRFGTNLPPRIVLANVHTHPSELVSRNKGSTDQEIFKAQYTPPKKKSDGLSDGLNAITQKTPFYTIGNYVDYYSMKGKHNSKNNICTNAELINGSFNILKHALQAYGKEHFF